MIEYFGRKPIYYETKSEQEKRLADNMLCYCDMRLKEINNKFPHEEEMKILAVRLHLETDLDLKDSYRVVFEKRDYYDIKRFNLDDLELYREYLYNNSDYYIYPMSEFEDVILAHRTPLECFELAYKFDEIEYRRAEYFRDSYYDLELFDWDGIEYEMNHHDGFKQWLKDCEYYYEKQKDIDDIIGNWEEEYKIEF